MAKIKNLPEQFKELWQACENLLEQARPGDLGHTKEMLNNALAVKRVMRFDWEVLLPAIMLHNVVYIAIEERHCKDIVVEEKLKSGKVIKLSFSGKIIKNLLEKADIKPEKIEEILEIITMAKKGHSKGDDLGEIYSTDNKKMFHDFNLLTRFNKTALREIKKKCINKEQFMRMVNSLLELFFFENLKRIAARKFKKVEGISEVFNWLER